MAPKNTANERDCRLNQKLAAQADVCVRENDSQHGRLPESLTCQQHGGHNGA